MPPPSKQRWTHHSNKLILPNHTLRDGIAQSDIQLRAVRCQRVLSIVGHQGHHRFKLEGLRKAVQPVLLKDSNEPVDSALSQREGVVAGYTGSVSDEEGPVWHVLHDVRHILSEMGL